MSYQQYCMDCGTMFTALGMRSKCSICYDREARQALAGQKESSDSKTGLFFIGWSAFTIFAIFPFLTWLGEKFNFSDDNAFIALIVIYFTVPLLLYLFSDDN